MNFSQLSLPVFIVGLGALAAALFLLQRLRVRHRPVAVMTTIFWKQAIEESRARVLVKRFRHPWAYLLILACASLLWLALAGPIIQQGTGDHWVYMIDASAAMASGDQLSSAIAELHSSLAKLDPQTREVLWCGAQVETMLAPGEATALLELRMQGRVAESCPSQLVRAIEQRTVTATSKGSLNIVVVGNTLLSEEFVGRLPAGVGLSRMEWKGSAESAVAANVGITALGLAAAKSGRWDRVDVSFELAGDGDVALSKLAVKVGGERQALACVLDPEQAKSQARFRIYDVPADGEVFQVELLTADANALDDIAQIALPLRQILRLEVASELEQFIEPLVAVDPALQMIESGGVVRIHLASAGNLLSDSDLPSLVFVTSSYAMEIGVPKGELNNKDPLLDELLAQADFEQFEFARDQEVARGIRVVESPVRQVRVRAEALEDHGLLGSQRWPLFLSQAVRWLANEEPLLEWAAAGQAVKGQLGLFIDSAGAQWHSPLAEFWPPRSDRYQSGDGRALEVSLLDSASTMKSSELNWASLPSAQDVVPSTAGFAPWWWLALLALLLIGVEGILYKTGRIP